MGTIVDDLTAQRLPELMVEPADSPQDRPTTREQSPTPDVSNSVQSDWWPSALGRNRWRKLPGLRRWVSPGAQQERFGVGYGVTRLLATPLYRLLWRVRVEGGEQLPSRGPRIIAANHVSFFDSVVLIMAARRTLSFVGKAEYLDSWKTRRVLPALGMIPVDRSDGRRAMAALGTAAGLLRAGKMFAIYPEGTRSTDGNLHAGHTGAAYLAMATGVPIVPTGIVGTNSIQPSGTRIPRPFRRVVIRFGDPINPASYTGSRRQRRRLITDDVMAAIQTLTHDNSNRPADAAATPTPG
jgi:1-acyl-sn-glycerol-3-phosphate acyltransferase